VAFLDGRGREEVARHDERSVFLLRKSFDAGRSVLAFERIKADYEKKRRAVEVSEQLLARAKLQLEDVGEMVEAREEHMDREVEELRECQVVVERTWPRGTAGYSIVKYKDGHVEWLPPKGNPRTPLPPQWLDEDIPVEMI